MRIPFLLKLGVSLGLLAVLLLSLDLPAIIGILGQSNLYLLAASIGTLFVFFVVSTLKWQLLLAHTGNTASYRELLRLNLLGQFYNMILPGQVGGEVVKGVRLRRFNVSAEYSAVSVLADRATGLLALMLLGLGGLALSTTTGPADRIFVPWVVLMVVALSGLVVFLLTGRGLSLLEKVCGLLRLSRIKIVDKVLSRLHSIRAQHRDFRALAALLALSFAAQAIVGLLNLLICLALNITLPFPEIMWVSAVVLVAQALPVSVAGLGIREGMYVYMLVQLGISAQAALAVSLLMFVTQLSIALLGGLLDLRFAAKDPRNMRTQPGWKDPTTPSIEQRNLPDTAH